MAEITGLLFILLTILCFYFVYRGLNKALIANQDNRAKKKSRLFLTGVAVWAGILFALSYTGILLDFSVFPPYMLIVLIIPLIITLRLSFSSKFSKLLAIIPTEWLIYIQSFRIIVELLLWMLFVEELLPIQMTFEGRNWDILVGITAPLILLLSERSHKYRKSILVGWNIIGLLLLLNIVVIALLSMPTPVRQFMNEPANTIVATFPYVLLPGFLVPLAYSMHIFSLKQLLLIKKSPAN